MNKRHKNAINSSFLRAKLWSIKKIKPQKAIAAKLTMDSTSQLCLVFMFWWFFCGLPYLPRESRENRHATLQRCNNCMPFSSKLIEQAVGAFAGLPGIGRKTALRLVLHLVRQSPEVSEQFADAIRRMRSQIRECSQCNNLSDEPLCNICTDNRRDRSLICVVESIRDLMAIEDTGQYRGLYHVLGGLISPIDGVGPEQLHIDSLLARAASADTTELIMAISPTIEGETTTFYLYRQLQEIPVKISSIARGVSFGGELEYADELTLGRSIIARTPYRQS